jgi:PTH1 family peptidyl-tRNA hydrolase
VKLVVGLGNPGPRYAASRHNVGFRIVDELARSQGVEILEERFQGLYAQGFVPVEQDAGFEQGAEPLAFLEPTTFMNRSGESVARAAAALETDPARELLVVCDDLDLPLGRIRLRPRGGAGGHNGMASVIECLGTKEFARLRFGIGRPDESSGSPGSPGVIDFVLDAFSREEERVLAERVPIASAAAAAFLRDGPVVAMDRYNRADGAVEPAGSARALDTPGPRSKLGAGPVMKETSMSDTQNRMHDEFEKLKQRRDEIRVQLDLGKKDARDTWDEVEGKWQQLEGKVKVLANEARDAAEDVASAAEVLMDEVRDGFKRLRKLI